MLFAAVILASIPTLAVAQVTGREQLTPAETRRRARLFDQHIVRMGETAFSIARGYAISPETLAEDNPGADITRVRVGQVLLVRKRERGKTDPEQVAREWRQMVEARAATTPEEDTAQTHQPQVDTLWSEIGGNRGGREIRRREPRDFSRGGTPNIALVLPLTGTSANPAGNDFTDFYKGALLGFEHLKAGGHSARVTLYNSERSTEKMQNIVTSSDFADTDLIIGPVYEDEMEPALRFGEATGVPVVSPLAPILNLDSEALFGMAPDQGSKYDKLRPTLEGDVNIVLISSGAADDAEFAGEITAELSHLGRNYGRFTVGQGDFVSLIDWERPNVFIVLAGSELTVNSALTTISSSYNHASATRSRRASISVVGNSRWAGYSGTSIDPNLFFKLNVKFVTNYYINRSDPKTRLFEARYLEMYGGFPSRSAFRGYDAVTLFTGALFESGFTFTDRLERVGATPLDTPYRFVRADGRFGLFDGVTIRRRVNDQWTLVSFSSDYNITTQ